MGKIMLLLERAQKVLTFFAHPDDETLAAGATIKKLSGMGTEIFVAIPATGIHSRRNVKSKEIRDLELAKLREDCVNALSLLGVQREHVYFGDFWDNEMDRHSLLEVIHWLEEILNHVGPDIVITHHRYCTNIDHRYCHEAVVVATRPAVKQHISVLCGEVPSSTGYLKPVRWEPNLYVNISEEELSAKLEAMKNYKGEVQPDPHPRSVEVLTALAKVRGAESGFLYAEAFMIQKLFT